MRETASVTRRRAARNKRRLEQRAAPTPPAEDHGRMDLRRIAKAGAVRKRDLANADRQLDIICEEVEQAGENRNVALAAELGEVTRKAIYDRLERRKQERAANTAKPTT